MMDPSHSPAPGPAAKLPASKSPAAKSDVAKSHVVRIHGWPVLCSLKGYRPSYIPHDLVAGLTLVAIAIPEQLATARLGGFSPQIGFFAFLAGSLAFAIFGSNRFLSSGSDSTITPIFAGSLALLAASGSPDYAALAGALALMVGLVLVAGGIFRLGWIADLLSIPVTVGFLAGISIHILISQLPAILGLPTPAGPMLQRLATLAEQLPQSNLFTLVIGLAVLALVTVSERIDVRIPGALIGLIAAAAAVIFLNLENRGVAVLGDIPGTLPKLVIPDIPIGRWLQLVPLALIIAIIVMVQTAATTRSFLSDKNQPPDVDRDFVGVGVGSIFSGLIGGFPVNASPPRTAIVAETGGKSQLAILVAAGIILGLLAFGGSLLRHVPQAARRRAAVCCDAHHPGQPDRFYLPAIVWRITAGGSDRRRHHRAADRTGGGDRNHAVAAARHMEQHPRPRHGLRTGAGYFDLVAVQPAHSRRDRTQCRGRGIPGAVVVSQCLSFPARCDGACAIVG
jgi:SulP family sulfate permease